MPIYTTRDLIPFVNQLEKMINDMMEDVESWKTSKGTILTSIDKIDDTTNKALTALVKSEEALTELNTATYGVIAQRGQRLKTLLDQLKANILDAAQKIKGSGQGYDERINAEIDNAISAVDPMIEDGLKLDYRLREIFEVASEGKNLGDKNFIIPYKIGPLTVTDRQFVIEPISNVQFVSGDLTILNEQLEPVYNANYEMIKGTIDANGQVTLSQKPNVPVILYFPAQLAYKDIPSDFTMYLLNMMIQKNSSFIQKILSTESTLNDVIKDIIAMKGENWTVDFSIMKNHQDIIKENITPKSLQVEVKNGMAHMTFSYNDHPYLDHFVVERWDDSANKWVPYDGINGVIPK